MASWPLKAVALSCWLIGVPLALVGQDTRMDRPGANRPSLLALCRSYSDTGFAAVAERMKNLSAFRRMHAEDSLSRATGCVQAMGYLGDAAKGNHALLNSPFGVSAIQDFARYLSLHPKDSTSALALGALALDLSTGEGVSSLTGYRQTIADRLYAAVHSGQEYPVVLRGCVQFNLAVGDAATARYCLSRALVLGIDSTWHLIRASWLASIRGDTLGAVRLMRLSAATARDSAALGEVGWYARTMLPQHSAGSSSNVGRLAEDTLLWAGLAGAQAQPGFLGELFKLCPVWSEKNGARLQGPSYRCTWIRGNPDQPIGIAANLFRVWNPSSGDPIGLFAFALERRDLDAEVANGERVATVDVDLRQLDWGSGQWSDTAVAGKQMSLPNKGGHATIAGYVSVPLDVGHRSWSIAVSQYGRYGRVTKDGSVPMGSGQLALSDLVIGVRTLGPEVRIGLDEVVLAPTDTVARRDTLQLFFQVRAPSVFTGLKSTITLRKIISGVVAHTPVLSLTAILPVPQGITGISRELSLGNVPIGDFQLEVSLSNAGGVVVRRHQNLFIRQ